MAWPEYKRDLVAPNFDIGRVLDRYFHTGPSHVFVGAPPETEPAFKSYVAGELHDFLGFRLHPLQLVICGSAHLGFSPVPEKLGDPFKFEKSDIDVAVVSADLFDRWWSELQSSDIVPVALTRVAEDLFRGFIDPSKVNAVSGVGRDWWDAFGRLTTDRARGVRGRLYRSYWSMQNYHRFAIVGGRKKLLGERM